jgi:hypothetical protein
MEGKRNQATSHAGQAIPARIVIGVTGHRKIENPILLGNTIQTVLKNIRQMVPALKSSPVLLSVLSPLAEGADRLIAREVLKIPGSLLEVVLPLEKEAYIQDFETDVSKKEFEELLAQAKSARVLSLKDNRDEAYERVGRYIVEQCDLLIALWDGKPSAGRGGTQEIVQYARESKCPLVWIESEDYSKIHFETGHGLDPRPFHDLDDYNEKSINLKGFETQLSREIKFFTEHAERARLPLDRARPSIEYLMNRYVRGDKLALYFQHLYYQSETFVYSLALAAVMIAAFQVLFLPDQPIILISEIVLMLAVLGIVWIGRRQRWHDRWTDYRFLAERFRSALFMAMADVDVAILRPPRHLSLAYSPKDWMVAAFSSVWRRKPRMPASDAASFEGVKQFLGEAWIEDQIRYHEATSRRHLARHQRMTTVSYILFGLTIGVVLLHVAKVGSHYVETVFAFLAVVFPAIAASITAVGTHRDYLRNSMRSSEMVRHLKELKDKMSRTQNRDEFFELVKETEETMLHENEDWRVMVRFHKTEVPV